MHVTGELRHELSRDHALLRFWESETELYVDTVFVPADARERGVGTVLMRRVLFLADAQGKPVRLKARPIGTTSIDALERLVRYYERLGFRVTRREASGAEMERPAGGREPSPVAS